MSEHTSNHPQEAEKSGPRNNSEIVTVTVSLKTIWLAVIIAALTVGFVFVLAKAIYAFLVFFVAIIFAEGIRPIVTWLRKIHVPRPVGVILVYLGIIGVLYILGLLIASPLLSQVSQFNSSMPQFMNKAQDLINRIQTLTSNQPWITNALRTSETQLFGIIGSIVGFVVSLPFIIGEFLVAVVVVIVVAFLWLVTLDTFPDFISKLLPERMSAQAIDIFNELGRHLGGYLRGIVFNMFVIGTLSGFANFILGVPFQTVLGIIAGITELIPYFGPWIGGVAAVAVALATVGIVKALEVALAYIIIQQIEGHTLIPWVMSHTVGLHPITVIFSVLVGGLLLGLPGSILAVPAAAVIQVILLRAVVPVIRRSSNRTSQEI